VDNGIEENWREYNVRRMGCEQRPSNQRRSTYNRHTTWNPNQSRNYRAEGGPSRVRELNPQVSEFAPADRNYRAEPHSEASDRMRHEPSRQENLL
jgi:hypothetical protein